MGNDCFASPGHKGFNEGVGGGYAIQRGILLCVSHLGPNEKGEEYTWSVCDQSGDVKGQGHHTCSLVTLEDSVGLKLERGYTKGYQYTAIRLPDKKINVTALYPPTEHNRQLINQILITLKFHPSENIE